VDQEKPAVRLLLGDALLSAPVNVVEQFRLPRLDEELARVEEALREAVSAEDPFLSEVTGHLVAAGGKRLRPALLIAATTAAGAEVTDDTIAGAVSVELVHLGSLYHDDVIDEAASRRGVPSANAQWGNLVAILAGDFLLARASEIAAGLGTEVVALLAQTIANLCLGEVSQLQYAFNPGRPEPAYLRSLEGKTASLMATSARIGGLVSDLPRPWVDALTQFGRSFGMAFQIWDDVRDLVSTEDQLGKPAGHDMVEGTYTLPVLRALASTAVGDELRALLGGPLDPPARDKARDLILSTDAIAASLTEARRWADRAAEALAPLRAGDAPAAHLDALGQLGHRLIDDLDV
jgi:heptaprenyl diphosphate synthase